LFARDGVEALAMLKASGGIDLVVTDINMPQMDNLSLLQKLQESEQGCRRSSCRPMGIWSTSGPP
jgi:CheY-like chemotaxis protein